MKIIRSLLICLLLSCFFSCEEVVELGVEGRVIDPNSQPITGATIALSGPESQQTVSDTEGNFFIGDITAGTYQITIEAGSYPRGSKLNRVRILTRASSAPKHTC